MAQDKISLNKLLDKAVDKLPFFRRKTTQWKLRNPEFREAVLMEVASQLSENPKVQAMGIPALTADVATAGGDEVGINWDADILIDLDKLQQLLDMLIKYLPAIIDLITKLFPK